MDSKVMAKLACTKVSLSIYIPLLLPKNHKPEPSYTPVDLFNLSFKGYCFWTLGKSHLGPSIQICLGEVYGSKTTFLLLLARPLRKLSINRIVKISRKLTGPSSTAVFLMLAPDRIAGAFIRLNGRGATSVLAKDIF